MRPGAAVTQPPHPYHPAVNPRRPTHQVLVGDQRTGIVRIGGGSTSSTLSRNHLEVGTPERPQ